MNDLLKIDVLKVNVLQFLDDIEDVKSVDVKKKLAKTYFNNLQDYLTDAIKQLGIKHKTSFSLSSDIITAIQFSDTKEIYNALGYIEALEDYSILEYDKIELLQQLLLDCMCFTVNSRFDAYNKIFK